MKSRIFAAAAAAAVLALSLSACAQQASAYGTWGTPDSKQQNEPGLQLGEDGKVSGTDGCNRLVGTFEVDGDTVTFGPLASTMMFCEGVDTWLGKAVTATVKGDNLTVLDQDGAKIGTLKRAASDAE
ncbi:MULTISPECIES: META domain-containing protein [unclassified Leucobacter]|uniref:META domain-containing protein n=1 Tax=unclassified Leucobacter TaxID=2621730 RepID=UPI00165E2AD5|nr:MULTISPECIES: META domain-containing protein [unclassified Leucobacter]MBC9926642.1 META domain-containing protein [Leucobacter sp. cx-169]MBC9937257.1 META domain-containing protein [Leucobacter sp. cx-87]